MDFKEFLAALSGDWVSLMSGIASVVLTVISVARRWQSIPRWALWVAAAMCFFLASARVWTTEHRARAAADQRLADLTKPKFKLELLQTINQYFNDTDHINQFHF